MRSVETWLDEYGESHRNPANKLLHWICVPVITLCVIGLLWSLPVPIAVRGLSPLANWGTAIALVALLYYLSLSASLAAGMSLVTAGLLVALMALDGLAVPLWQICLAAFALAWIGQFVGHAIEGRKPSFFKDLQFLLIGPLWLLAAVYRRLGIRY